MQYQAHANPAAVAPLPVWEDARFQVPFAFLSATVLATATFAVLHYVMRKRDEPTAEGKRDQKGWSFPEAGYVLCPQGAGLPPTEKDIAVNSVLVLGLGSPTAVPVEPAWAVVSSIDSKDPNRVEAVLVGQATPTGQADLQTDRHGFRLSQKIWVTRDCVWEVLEMLADPQGRLLCGPELVTFDGPDVDMDPDGLSAARMPPGPPQNLVGRRVELYLVSKAGKGTAWQVPVEAEVVAVGTTGHVATVRVLAFGRSDLAEDPRTGHSLRPGQQFDVTWDCVVRYL